MIATVTEQRVYTDALSLEEQSCLEEEIERILSYPDYFYAAKIIYLILIEWGEHIYPNIHLRSMLSFTYKLIDKLHDPSEPWKVRDGITPENLLFFCIEQAFPQFIQEQETTYE